MRRPSRLRRGSSALVLAVVAVIAAGIGALLPAHHLRTSVSWPPASLQSPAPQRAWYTPLLVARHQPDLISARIPCELPPALPHAPTPVVVLATARAPASGGGLALIRTGRSLTASVGSAALARLPLSGGRCTYNVELAGGTWTITGGTPSVTKSGAVGMPVVDGLFSNLDLAARNAPSIIVTTVVHGSRTTAAQTVARLLALLAALAALILVSRPRLPRRIRIGRPRLIDGVVVLALLGWWVIGPAYFDDGWILASQKNFAAASGYTTYYDSFAASSSLQYWLSWSEHELYVHTNSLLLLRLPALVCLTATWILCRWIFGRISVLRVPSGIWTLACAFLVGAFAWGMTLRPEPVVALLVIGVFACVVRFLARPTAAPLALAAVLIALAVSAHPAGAVSIAPLIVAAPELFAWARTRWTVVATIVVSTLALVGVLIVLGSDLAQLHANTTSLRAYGEETAGWRDELTRYGLLSRPLYGAPLRRAWVAIAVLIVLAYLVRRRRDGAEALLGLPARSLGVALVLLIATPAKLPWHFGTLIGVAALAAGAEMTRIAVDARESRWHPRPFIVLGAAMVAAAWAWYPRNAWSDLDLRTLHWTLGFERRVTIAKLGGIAPLVVLAAFVAFDLLRRRRVAAAPWQAALWAVPVVALPLLVFTAAVFAADTAKTKSWTVGRQNLHTLRGDTGCGLADDTLVAQRSSMRALPSIGPLQGGAASWLPPAPAPALGTFSLGPAQPARSTWFALRPGTRFGFFSTAVSTPNAVQLEWGRRHGARVDVVGTSGVTTYPDDARPDITYWRFYPATTLPGPPTGANAVRFAVRSTTQIGLTEPVTYAAQPLVDLLRRQRPALALPNLAMYFPCLHQPRVSGVAEVPKLILAFRSTTWPLGTGTSPFDELPEIYSIVRLPLTGIPNPDDVAVYEIDRTLPGFAVAPPVYGPAG